MVVAQIDWLMFKIWSNLFINNHYFPYSNNNNNKSSKQDTQWGTHVPQTKEGVASPRAGMSPAWALCQWHWDLCMHSSVEQYHAACAQSSPSQTPMRTGWRLLGGRQPSTKSTRQAMNRLTWSHKACLDLSIQHWLHLRAAKESENQIPDLRFTAGQFTRVAGLNRTVDYRGQICTNATCKSQQVCTSPWKGLQLPLRNLLPKATTE